MVLQIQLSIVVALSQQRPSHDPDCSVIEHHSTMETLFLIHAKINLSQSMKHQDNCSQTASNKVLPTDMENLQLRVAPIELLR